MKKSEEEPKDEVIRVSDAKNSNNKSEKSDLARQILLNFVVKSVQNGIEPVNGPASAEKSIHYAENSLEAVANDHAIIKILHGNKEKPLSNNTEEPNMNNKVGDGEGLLWLQSGEGSGSSFLKGWPVCITSSLSVLQFSEEGMTTR